MTKVVPFTAECHLPEQLKALESITQVLVNGDRVHTNPDLSGPWLVPERKETKL